MKKIPFYKAFFICIFIITPIYFASAQQIQKLVLDSCYRYAETNYPLVKQKGLIDKTTQYNLSNLSKGYFPQLNIGGQATYQSEVTQIQLNGTLPPQLNIEFPTIDKDQYKIYGEIVQPLTDLVNIRTSQKIIRVTGDIEEQKIEVEMHKIREKIIQIFLGIKLLDEQLILNDLLQNDLRTGIKKTEKWIANGLAFRSNLDLMNAELLKAQQNRIEIESARKVYTLMLSQFIGREIDDQVELVFPDLPEYKDPSLFTKTNERPELSLFDYQKNLINQQKELLNIKTIPKFSLFLQSGYGRPALNMLSPDFNFYYIGGVRLQWNLSTFYTFGKEQKILKLQENSIDVQRDLFLFNTNLQLIQQQKEIEKYTKMIQNDEQIIKLRENVKKSAQNQLTEGTISATDYITFINAEERAKQDLTLHRMQLLIAIYQYNSTLGK
jgi:outer membrane protein TolC